MTQQSTNNNIVFVVHCIDAEGPLTESLTNTFERIFDIYGIRLKASPDILNKLQRREMHLGNGLDDALAKMLAPPLLDYKRNWSELNSMLDTVGSADYRFLLPDSYGNSWVFNWFCVDHVGYENNPRHRDIGFHNIFDFYTEKCSTPPFDKDGIHFHYHPMPFNRMAHHSATQYFAHSDTLFQILARRVIDRLWFPCCNRPGFHVTRPDSHWFLEQFIPFDFANQSMIHQNEDQADFAGGRFGDWRKAPISWVPYHPHHDCYQSPGQCRRLILRCLNVGTRLRLLTPDDVKMAFEEAAAGKPVVLAFCNHDFRDLVPDVAMVQSYLSQISAQFPQVKFQYCEAREAIRAAMGLQSVSPFSISLRVDQGLLTVETSHRPFGPQPFLALKTRCGTYYYDNLDLGANPNEWLYRFDVQTIPYQALEAVGVAACDSYGQVAVSVLDCEYNTVTRGGY